MSTTPKVFNFRQDGPITGDIKPLNLEGRDIKIVYEEVMIKYKKINEREFIGVGKLELINLITDLIYLRNCLSPFYIKCTEKEFKTLSKNYSVVNHEKDFSDIYENLGFFRVQPDSYDPDFIFIKRKRRLAVKSKDDYIIDSTFVFAPIDKSYKPKDLSYSKFLIENRIQRLIEVQLHEKLSIKNSGSASEFSESSYFYDISKYTMFKRKSSAKYFTEFNEYHERIEKSLGNIKYDSKTTRESVDFLHKSSNPGYIVFKSDEMRAKNKALMFYEVCKCIFSILQYFIYIYELKLSYYITACKFENTESVSIDFFKKFNYFTVMYDWDEFKDIKSKPKKIDVLNSFITCYFIDSIVKFKAESKARLEKKAAKSAEVDDAEKKAAKKFIKETDDIRDLLSTEPVGEKSIDQPENTDCTSIKYDKGNCEYIRKEAAKYETDFDTYNYNQSEWIVLLSVIYTIPLLKDYYEELKNEKIETLIDKLDDKLAVSKPVTKDDRKKIKYIARIIKKQIVRLGYIYFTFYKYLDPKNKDTNPKITFDEYCKYINRRKSISTSCSGWYIHILKWYGVYILRHKAIFDKPEMYPDIFDKQKLDNTYFGVCMKLMVFSGRIYENVENEKNPFDSISVSKNTEITYYYNKELDLLSEYSENVKKVLSKVKSERGNEDHER